ncbi:MAG: hypothetical protein KA956_09755 [Pyrinomonadaceae bacterium]|nr:hypothetical protein [Acidobacteriota bacterium]MBK7934291.1 hypothetical protein [Acidobacteriota bacterium]MBP7376749.1 hypothetical protein [Pyrinomonadaceae bacterium]
MTVRLTTGGEVEVFVDLLFATSGIEREVIADATELEPFPTILVKLASTASLLAMKVLSADWKICLQDVLEIHQLLEVADLNDIERARELLELISERGYNRSKDLQTELAEYIARFQV